MRLYDLKVNHLHNPLGFRMERTVFAWKTAEAAGKKQESARILVAADECMSKILFDSGFDREADPLGYPAPVSLYPRTRYYWSVTVRTDAGEEATGEVQWFETGKREEDWKGRWITCQDVEDTAGDQEKGISSNRRHPYFEKEIDPSGEAASARLYICGLGLYEAYYVTEDGEKERIGQEYLTPYCNDYKEWTQYQTFDVTECLQRKGKLQVLLGNGWYKARFGFSSREEEGVGFYGDSWKLIAELHLTYKDGREEVIGTDESWITGRSNITFSNLYDGEWVDETLDALPCTKAVFCEAPAGRLTERMSLPVCIHETFHPAELLHTPAGEQVFDMGQEFTGIFALKIKEPAGTRIHIQTGEILQQGNFYNENLRSAKSEYYYTTAGGEQVILPHFTFYGYRYVKVEGVTDLKKEDFTGFAYYSDLEAKGSIRTGHASVNRLVENVKWGLQSNFVDVPTDCPQRDERMGWTGDAQVFSPTATYLKDTYAFYAKYLYDMALEQRSRDGKVPDVVPSFDVESCACVWGDACCIIPWNLYLFYGDKSILEDQFESMRSWVDYITKIDGDDHGWRYRFHYGDWLALDNPAGGAEQTLGATDEEFIANVYYAVSAGIVAKAAAVLGRKEEQERYAARSEEQFRIVKEEYYSSTGRCCIKTQTALLLTLKYHLSDNIKLTKEQLTKLFEQSGHKLKTGFVGTPLLGNVLSENGYEKLAYELLLNEEYPGWLYEVKLGATTMWERWNSLLADGTISGISMNSMNHYAYGSIVEWMFRHAAGINSVEEAPGFTQAVITPALNWQLGSLEAEYDSPSGVYKSAWNLTDPTHVELSVTIPFGCTARLKLPHAGEEIFAEGRENPILARVEDGLCVLEAGTYQIAYETDESLRQVYNTRTPVRELLRNKKTADRLAQIMPLDQIPDQFRAYSLREIAEKFGGRTTEEQLDGIDRMLEAIDV